MSRADIHRTLHDLFNKRDFDGMDRYIRPDITYIDHARGIEMKNRDEFKEWLGEWTAAMSDATPAEPRYSQGDGFSLARFHGRGTNDGPMGPFPPTGRRMDVPFCELLHFDDDGLVYAAEIYYDQATILAQFGHIQLPTG